MTVNVIDLFAGAGGWDLAARQLGLDPLGVELDEDACATRDAAGLRTLRGDVAALGPIPCDGLIASPPCQAWSKAGKRLGIEDQPVVFECLTRLARGEDARPELRSRCRDERSLLVVEPLRWALAVEPVWVALEQVPDVLPCWGQIGAALRLRGYKVWTGVLNAANYGVPQTRERAILIASRVRRPVGPPPPSRSDQRRGGCLLGLAPWVSMADALGWGMERPSYTVLAGGPDTGGPEPFTSTSRRQMERSRERGNWVVRTGANTMKHSRTGSKAGEGGVVTYERSVDEPAPTVDSKVGAAWKLHTNRDGRNVGGWGWERPATTVTGDARVHPPGHKANAADPPGKYEERRGANAVRVTIEEASILQDFPPDYPWQGTKTARFRQIGNAIPPGLAHAVLEVAAPERARAVA